MTSDEKFKLLLQRIEQLERIILDQGSLGLSQGRQFIYIQKSKNSLWSFIATDEPVNANSITGYIKDIYRKEDDVPKLHIVVRTREAEYVLCSGFETHFSRDVMAAIAQLKPQQLKRPLKIIPTVKEPKPGEKQGKHQPVYANVLFDDQTIRTYQLKRDLSAQQLFDKAIAVLKGGNSVKPSQRKVSSSQTQKVTTKPPGLDDELPPIPPMKAIAQTAASHGGGDVETGMQVQSVDWKAFCKQHGILPGVLKSLAQELGLPMGRLNPSQNATLYNAAWKRFVGGAQ